MALTTYSLRMVTSYTDENTPVAGAKVVKDQDSLTHSLSPVVGTYNRRFRQRYTLAAAATQIIDLGALTDPVSGAAVVLTKAISFQIKGTQAFRIEPNAAANPLPWFFGIAANYMTLGADEGFAITKAVTFTTGSKLLLTNQGGSSGTFDVVIIGGT